MAAGSGESTPRYGSWIRSVSLYLGGAAASIVAAMAIHDWSADPAKEYLVLPFALVVVPGSVPRLLGCYALALLAAWVFFGFRVLPARWLVSLLFGITVVLADAGLTAIEAGPYLALVSCPLGLAVFRPARTRTGGTIRAGNGILGIALLVLVAAVTQVLVDREEQDAARRLLLDSKIDAVMHALRSLDCHSWGFSRGGSSSRARDYVVFRAKLPGLEFEVGFFWETTPAREGAVAEVRGPPSDRMAEIVGWLTQELVEIRVCYRPSGG